MWFFSIEISNETFTDDKTPKDFTIVLFTSALTGGSTIQYFIARDRDRPSIRAQCRLREEKLVGEIGLAAANAQYLNTSRQPKFPNL